MSATESSLPINVREVLASPGTSFWLKQAIRDNLDRDPVDAISDAEVLVVVLQNHLQDCFS